MGFLSALGKIGGLVADFIPGGSAVKGAAKTIGKVAGAAGDVSSVLGKQQQGKAQGQISQAQLQQIQDRNAIDLFQAAQNAQNQAGQLDLQRKGFETSNRGAVAKQALIGALLGGGVQPTKVGPEGASGGLLRSLNANPDALAALKLLGSQGAAAQAAPLSFQGGQMLPAPTLSKLPQIDNGGFLATLANIGQLAGAVSPYIKGGGDPNVAGPSVARQAVDVLGAIPGGAMVPRTANPLLSSVDLRNLQMGNG